jgi:[acyl-carrier-protein] S-malonyltransferase
MGLDLYESSAAARAIFDRAGEEVKHDCFDSDAEHLKQTEVTQPAVYTMDMACFAALTEAAGDAMPAKVCYAGFSLGEYAALTAAGVIASFEEGLALVRQRSRLMKEAGVYPDGSPRGTMAAGMGEKSAILALVELSRGKDVLEAVNFNSPAQTVVAGDATAVARFAQAAKEDRSLGVKAIPLSVSGAFHSPIMAPAAEGLASVLAAYTFSAPRRPVYLNVTGRELVPTEDVKEVMVRQIQNPVQWQETVEQMEVDDVMTLIEVGPGKTLSGLVKKITPEIEVCHVEDAESLAAAADFIRNLR